MEYSDLSTLSYSHTLPPLILLISQVSADIVNSAVTQLYDNVVSKIGITDVSDLKLRAQSNLTETRGTTNLACELVVQFKRV